MMRYLCAIAALALLAEGATGRPAPVLPSGMAFPLEMPAMPLHDPWIVVDRASRTYRLFTRNEAAISGDDRLGIMAYTSHDLHHWSRPRLVFALPRQSWADDGGWAPEVHRWRGRWYLFATFHNRRLALPPGPGGRPLIRRSTMLAVADRLEGPYTVVRGGASIVDPARMTLDGTLYVDPAGKPWLVYAHEWLQTGDGTIEAVALDAELAAVGTPRLLFHASDAAWVSGAQQAQGDTTYVTDGPELYRTRTGTLLMLWSSYDKAGYVQGLARSQSGTIDGPWEQLPPLLHGDSGHGMLFHALDGTLMMVVHRPFANARGKLYVMHDDGDHVSIVREATEFDGETQPLVQ